ncbi:TPA: H-NS histone family protein [Burkholderia cepacia]|uniref:H-NS histone family protein n=1 Tax=Burkholderia cepacia TaxID=292 RepID=UPI000D2F3DA3|nr:H-NS histone family protein [Burkholderia cepacia]MCA8357629.1 H-NS histone family protein [Burkholderia cepacia]HDV6370371.1 H-NS histone family protein [Burkholderia cepacia]
MATYQELKAQMDALAEKAEAARLAEFHSIVEAIRAQVAKYGITEKDIFGARRGRTARTPVAPVAAKYHDPKTGATWSGRGRAPAWIKDAKNRNRFLIQQ